MFVYFPLRLWVAVLDSYHHTLFFWIASCTDVTSYSTGYLHRIVLDPTHIFVSFFMDGMAFEEMWFLIGVCKLVGNTKQSYCSSEVSFQRWISRQLEGRTQINPPKRNPVRMRAKTKNWYVLYFQESICCCYFFSYAKLIMIFYSNMGVAYVCKWGGS